jgi:septum formation protein
MGREVAVGRDLARAQGVSAPPTPPILLASTSPQRRAILEQLAVPFEIVPPRYTEQDAPGLDPVELVKAQALGKARSVAETVGERPVLGVDTAVVLDGKVYGKPQGVGQAEEMLEALSGRTHEVISGLCLRTQAWEEVEAERTLVTFRVLTPRDIATYLAAGEWEGRAGAYAIQGLGASLVERIEGDYLNVVGLPAALLIRLLAERFAGAYGFG